METTPRKSALPALCAGTVITIGCAVLTGWFLDVNSLKSILPGYITMKANTAVCFIALACAMLLVSQGFPGRVRRTLASLLCGFVALVSVVTLLQYLLGWNSGIDEFLFTDAGGSSGLFPAGRLAPITALNFIFLSLSIVLVTTFRLYRTGQFLTFLALIAGVQGLIGYAIGLTYLFGSAFYTQMAAHTTAAFILLCVGQLAAIAEHGFLEAFSSRTPGALLARRMLAAIIVSPILVKWLADFGVKHGYYDRDFSSLMQMVGGMAVMSVILIWTSVELCKAEKQREEAREKAEAASRAKTNFLANISHELRTPLGAVLGFSELLASEENSDLQKGDLKAAIRRNGNQLLRLIDDLLDVSKIEAGHLNMELSTFSLYDFLRDLEALSRLKAEVSEVRFSVEYKSALPERIVSDSVRLRQVMLNVIGNAIKFNSSRGRVVLSVEFAPLTHPRLRFTVRDSGPGISAETVNRLFQTFSQGDASATRRYGGFGLGLSLSRKLAQRLGGDLTLKQTELGVGSVFEVEIDPGPIEQIRLVDFAMLQSRPARTEFGVQPATSPLKGRHILLVEDSEDNRALISRFLMSSGAEVEMACDGIEGVDKALHGKFDIVLMDLQMPNLDGYSAIKKLRGIGYKVPIVALTAHAQREDRQQCLSLGFNEHLTKPVNKNHLIRTVETFVKSV